MTTCTNADHGLLGVPCACAITEIRRVVTVPHGPHSATQAIEKSGLVNIQSAGIVEVTELTYGYAIIGYEPSEPKSLTIELTDRELDRMLATLDRLAGDIGRSYISVDDKAELRHLRTLLAEATKGSPT